MNYSRLQLRAYNDEPDEEGCFHCESVIDVDHTWNEKELFLKVVKPMFGIVYSRMIPEMPRVMSQEDIQAFTEWHNRYYGG